MHHETSRRQRLIINALLITSNAKSLSKGRRQEPHALHVHADAATKGRTTWKPGHDEVQNQIILDYCCDLIRLEDNRRRPFW